jgi:hypothetical protein
MFALKYMPQRRLVMTGSSNHQKGGWLTPYLVVTRSRAGACGKFS